MQTLSNLKFDFDEGESLELTHSIHPYPAKFPAQLPRRILQDFSKPGDLILDPFCGSGTTLVEARVRGVNAIGVDINGLACLISKVKSTPISSDQYSQLRSFIRSVEDISFRWTMGAKTTIKVTDFDGLSHWFQQNVAEEITLILSRIENLANQDLKDFLRVVLSSIIVRVSNQESDTRFAAIKKDIPDGFCLSLFTERAKTYLDKLMEFSKSLAQENSVQVVNADTRNLSFLADNSIDLILTSPPYANTYDYYLYHKFRKRWLGLDVQFAQYNEIGSRREFSSLKESPKKWLTDLRQCLSEMTRVLKGGSLAFVVIGDSVINKVIIRMDEEIRKLSSSLGLTVRHILSSELANHSKVFNPSFAQKGKKEHLIILQKVQ
jgi:DNA modification methylase